MPLWQDKLFVRLAKMVMPAAFSGFPLAASLKSAHRLRG
jgi:hypothetical protein